MELITTNYHWLILVAGCTYILLEIFILIRIKKYHVETYIQLGEPSIYFNISFKKMKMLSEYIFKRKYKSLNDQAINLLSSLLIINFIVVIVLIILFGMRPEQ